jgi:hypothetical protein
VVEESTDLPEGTEVELQLVKVADAFADMAPEDRDELEEAIEEGIRDFEDGDHIGAREKSSNSNSETEQARSFDDGLVRPRTPAGRGAVAERVKSTQRDGAQRRPPFRARGRSGRCARAREPVADCGAPT